jgi:tricorn protease
MPRAKASPAGAPALQGYYRFPTIHGDRIVFVSDDDLWVVGVAGGIASRLTTGKGPVSRPVFSPDGRWIAYQGFDEGVPEIYVIPGEGGEPRRITFLGAQTHPIAWTPDGSEIVFASDTGQPFMMDQHLYAVPPVGGPHRALNFGPARGIAFEPGGRGVLLSRNGGDPARWKRYRGGTAGTLWLDAGGRGAFRQILPDLKGNLASPMWLNGRLYFLSDHEGIGNLYSVRAVGRGPVARHTNQEEFYARFPATDGRRIVYHAGADLFLFDPRTGEDRRVPPEFRSARPQRQRKFVSGDGLEDYDPHPAGHSLVVTVRGRPVAMGLWEGPATEFGTPWRGRHRLARWLNDGQRIVAVTDEDGEERLEIFTPGKGVTKIDVRQDLGRITDLIVAPAPQTKPERGRRRRRARAKAAAAPDRIAISNQRQELWIVDLTRSTARKIDKSDWGWMDGISWSPDARWIAYGYAAGRRSRVIRLADAATGKHHQITSGDFLDFEPCFDPEGKYLYFLSLRTYDPVYDLIQFGLGFPRGVRPHLITLRADEPTPFLPAPRPLGPAREGPNVGRNPWDAESASGAATIARQRRSEKGHAPLRIDLEGIERRVVPFPVAEGRFSRMLAAPGRVFLLSHAIEGSLGQSWMPGPPPPKAAIEVYDLRELKWNTFLGGVSDFTIGRDGKTLVYRAGARLRALLASADAGKAAPENDEPGRASGWIDLARVRCSVDPAAEWRQMLGETWRLQRDQYWTPDMAQIDWERVHRRYLPLVERVATRGELSDLIWEMQGELGTSHAYEVGGDYRRPPSYPVGFLGADLECDRRRGVWKVARLPEGDPWDPQRSSPLAAPGVNVKPGTTIVAVAGQTVGRDLSPMECLVHRADQEVWLTVLDPAPRGGKAEPRTIVVKTLRDERGLRRRTWVEANRAWVHAHSGGRVGYLHIPDMGPLGYAEFHRYFLAELDRPALIVDVRHNGGGHVSQLLFDKLQRRRVGANVSRHMGTEPYPSEAPQGPMVALTDEFAGSDGDIFCHAWKLFRLGPLVGKRTWGGVIGIWPRHPLVDQSVTTQPEFSFWFRDVGWGVENYGTDPDIEVDLRPQDCAAGRDPQLERALREALRQLRGFREVLPRLADRPSRALPQLPRVSTARRRRR